MAQSRTPNAQLEAALVQFGQSSTPEQAAFSANKNLVTRAVGVEDTVLLETHPHELMPGDTYLLCSDGLSDMLDDATIEQLMQGADALTATAHGLVDAANDAGGKDNISVLLARVRTSARSSHSTCSAPQPTTSSSSTATQNSWTSS